MADPSVSEARGPLAAPGPGPIGWTIVTATNAGVPASATAAPRSWSSTQPPLGTLLRPDPGDQGVTGDRGRRLSGQGLGGRAFPDPGHGVPGGPRRRERLRRAHRPERRGARRTHASDHAARFRLVDRRRWRWRPKAPGPSGSRAGATRGRPGCTTPRSRSRPASTSSLVCTEGKTLFEAAADRASAAGAGQVAALLRGAAKSLDSGQQVEDRLEVVLADDVRAAMATYGPRDLVSPTPDYPIFVDRKTALYASWYEFFPRSQGCGVRRGDRHLDVGHLRLLPRAVGSGRGDGLRRHLPASDPPDRHASSARDRTTP